MFACLGKQRSLNVAAIFALLTMFATLFPQVESALATGAD
jgi:hypothetical protein